MSRITVNSRITVSRITVNSKLFFMYVFFMLSFYLRTVVATYIGPPGPPAKTSGTEFLGCSYS